MTKKSYAEMLRKYRKNKAEDYAKVILSAPEKVTLYHAIPHPGVCLIMGNRRMGKTGLAHEIVRQYHSRKHLPAVLHIPAIPDDIRKKLQKKLPKWFTITRNRNEWPKNCIVVYDEAAQSAHARRTQSGDAVQLDDLIGISGQRKQTILFIAHHSRKLDINVVHEVNRIIWKKPTYAHQLWERDELSDFTMRAYDFFHMLTPKQQLRSTLILNMDKFGFMQCTNRLPEWWTEELSCIFQDLQKKAKGVK